MTSLELYRALIPAHAAVPDQTVLVFLELAARNHSPAPWGVSFADAMVYWAAHRVQRSGHVPGSPTDPSAVGPLISQKDGDLSRTYAAPAVSSASSSGSAAGDLSTTSYGAAYLELRSKLTARLPTIVI